ncbi:hypothetical protein PAXINDRAFT_7889 [Paxillus involutus ATCC 200175]|nr:hypothetical protein PAXINDRAFT_7889 [Paxillus involutus ATCC 200175]
MKKDHALVENLARSFDDTSKKLLAKLSIQSLKNTGVPKAARSMPDLHFPIDKTASFSVDCSISLHTDLTKPRDVVVLKFQKEFDNFSFHTVDEEEWTSEAEARKQNALNRLFSSMKRELAIHVPKLSSYFSDDSLADSATRAPVKVRVPRRCESAREREFDNCSFYSADEEDESEGEGEGGEGEESSVITAPESPLPASEVPGADKAIVPTCHSAPSPSSQTDVSVTVEQQDLRDPGAEIPADGTSDVWQLLAAHVPTLLTRISEESLADEYEIEAIAQPPPLSFKRPSPPYARAEARDEDQWMTSYATIVVAEDSPRPSVEVKHRTLRGVGGLADLKTLVLPTSGSVSSVETMCETIAISEGACTPLEFRGPPLRRVARYSDLRKSYLRTDVLPEATSGCSGPQRRSLRRFTQCDDLKASFILP